jgi:hypothetical protein
MLRLQSLYFDCHIDEVTEVYRRFSPSFLNFADREVDTFSSKNKEKVMKWEKAQQTISGGKGEGWRLIEFEKDQIELGHVSFINAAANLRYVAASFSLSHVIIFNVNSIGPESIN